MPGAGTEINWKTNAELHNTPRKHLENTSAALPALRERIT